MEHKNFEKQIDEIVTSLESEIQKIDSIYLMSRFNQELILSINSHEHRASLPEGFVQKFHYIYGLIVSKSLTRKKIEKNCGDVINNIINLTEELFKEYRILWITRPSLNGSLEPEKVQDYHAGFIGFISGLHQPKLGSSEQFIDYTINYFKKFDDQFIIPKIGVETNKIKDIFMSIIEKVQKKYKEFLMSYKDTNKPVTDMWEEFRTWKITLEEAKDIADKNPIFKHLNQRLNNLATHNFKDVFLVSIEDLVKEFPESVLDSFFSYFSAEPGGINKEFRYPVDFNELDIKPFIKIDKDKYYVPEVPHVFHKLPSALESGIVNSKYKESYHKHRSKFAQRRTVELLGKVFTKNNIVENAFYGYKNNRDFETDVLIKYERLLIICEIKSKPLRSPLHTEGHIIKIKDDFKETLQDAYEQAIRTRDYILSREISSFVDKRGRHICDLKRSDFNNYFLMIVTAESYGGLATDLSILL